MRKLPIDELTHILAQTGDLWTELRGARLFITGGSGFFGRWLLESFRAANQQAALRAHALVLTRDPAAFARQCPWLTNDPAIELLTGDVRTFAFPPSEITHVIHAATPASARLNNEAPREMWDIIVDGTRRVLELAVARGARSFLFTSSGAVYGRQPAELSYLPETYLGGPDPLDPVSAYAEGKRAAEWLCASAAQSTGLPVKIARGFAFIGPHLPLDTHFAAGNFLRDALRGEPISVNGDGTPYRSYLYAADLAHLAMDGACCVEQPDGPYNVGSDGIINIADLAHTVASLFDPHPPVHIARAAPPGVPISRYVPDIQRPRDELGLRVTIPLREALRRTACWHQEAGRLS